MALGIILIIISILMFVLDIVLIVKWVNKKYYEPWELHLKGLALSAFGALSFCILILGAAQFI